MNSRRTRIYEGKAKILYEGPEPGTIIVHFKDDATAFNAQKKAVIEGKGVLNQRISEFIFTRLNELGIPTHFLRSLNMREQLVREVEIVPLEVVVRNVAAMVPPFETSPGYHGVSAALEFAVQVLKVRKIVVLGHGMCGGCRAALTQELEGTEPGEGGFIADWIALLDDARNEVAAKHGTEGRVAERAMEQAGVQVSLDNLRTFPCIRRKERSGELKLTGAFFAISDGVLHVLDEATGEFSPVE